jgi:hypothetical protein
VAKIGWHKIVQLFQSDFFFATAPKFNEQLVQTPNNTWSTWSAKTQVQAETTKQILFNVPGASIEGWADKLKGRPPPPMRRRSVSTFEHNLLY